MSSENGKEENPSKNYILSSSKYEEVFKESIENPESFWSAVGKLVSWSKPWKKVLDNSSEPFTKWFVGGEINACYNAVDRHVEAGNGSKVALIYDSPCTGVSRKITYSELLDKISKLTGLLAKYGVQRGDKVIIYMPPIPETVMAMLAVARLGAAHSVVYGGFAAAELATRIDNAEPKVIIAASCGIESNKVLNYISELNHALDMSRFKPNKCVIFQRKNVFVGELYPERDIDWEEAVKNVDTAPCVPVEANEPLYILYTSGTTGEPKGVLRPVGGHLAMLAFTMKTLYKMGQNDVWWAVSDLGWIVGHSYMCYGPLIHGITSIIYEGKPTTTPDPSSYFRIIDEYKVNSMFTVPTGLRILRDADPEATYGVGYDTTSLRQVWVAGEHLDITTKIWMEKIFNVPVMNHWGQTETGTVITGTCEGLTNPCSSGKLTCGLLFPGYNVQILKDGRLAEVNELGNIVVKLPLPPGAFSTLYNADEQFLKTYFTTYHGYYDTMDTGYMDENGFLYITARVDDIINVGGHRLSTTAIENIILSHPDISNACVVAVPDKIKTDVPLCLFVMKKNSILSEYVIAQELVSMVRKNMGEFSPYASFELAAAVTAIPTNRSGKICRKLISNLSRNKLEKIPSTVDDPSVYKEIGEVLQKLGFCHD